MILQTARLLLRDFTDGDAAFMLGLFNDPAFQRHIGDKGVRTEEEARSYVAQYYISSYAQHGFGPYCVVLKATGAPIGMCGILKRAWLPDPDIGYAFMPEYRGKGYATEAGQAVVKYAQDVVGLPRLVAIINNDNTDSKKLIGVLGFQFEGMVRESEDKPEVALFALDTRSMERSQLQHFTWEGLSGEHADNWRFTQGVTHDFPWARWTSPMFGEEEAWTYRFVLNCLVHPNPQDIPFDTWLNRDLLDTEKQFRASARETFAGRDALRSAPVAGWENLDTLLFVHGHRRVYQMRIAGLAAETRTFDKSLTALISSLRIESE